MSKKPRIHKNKVKLREKSGFFLRDEIFENFRDRPFVEMDRLSLPRSENLVPKKIFRVFLATWLFCSWILDFSGIFSFYFSLGRRWAHSTIIYQCLKWILPHLPVLSQTSRLRYPREMPRTIYFNLYILKIMKILKSKKSNLYIYI